MQLIPLPAFSDNYIWLLHHRQQVVVVDPGEARGVREWLQARPDLHLAGILVTHHHADHTAGLTELVQTTGAPVYGPAQETLPVPHHPVAAGAQIALCDLNWQVLDVPGHTAGHVAYWTQPDDQAPILLCGDTLFSGGCGRLFEGTPAQMLHSLDLLSALPDDTRVCCAHEYTLANLRFALAVEPDNPDLQAHVRHCQALREQQQPTLPTTLALERQINPFLRSRLPSVREAVQAHFGTPLDGDAHAFAALREWKNTF